MKPRTRRRYGQDPFTDMLFNVLLVLSLLFAMALVFINPPALFGLNAISVSTLARGPAGIRSSTGRRRGWRRSTTASAASSARMPQRVHPTRHPARQHGLVVSDQRFESLPVPCRVASS